MLRSSSAPVHCTRARPFLSLRTGFRALCLALLALGAVALPRTASALAFAPTETEWNTWPEFCRARYVVSGAGVDSSFAGRVDPGVVRSWEARLGPDVWYALHHYCAGLILANRGKLDADKKDRKLTLEHAIEEFNFTQARVPETHPMFAEMAARKGLIYGELGESEQAMRNFDAAIASCADCSIGYEAKATFYRTGGQLEDARRTLERGNDAMGGQSSEIHYQLGLVLVELKDFNTAQEHARRAYELGYPLPGLRDRLAKVGHPIS
jgi:tetratricopeptide (TPR) repeat protein